jgi:hypothetical protein
MKNVALEGILKRRKEVEAAEMRRKLRGVIKGEREQRRRSNMGRKRTKRILKRGGSVDENGDGSKYGYFMNQIRARAKATGL